MKVEKFIDEDYKKCLCDTFKRFDEICDENNLQYYACAGTCLGAIRHKGLIPWDDDVDVYMPRKDYDKLLEMRASFQPDYEIVDYHTPYYNQPFSKFCNANTTIVETLEFPAVMGVYVDIFPLDEVGDVTVARCLFEQKNNFFEHYRATFRILNFKDLVNLCCHLHVKTVVRKIYYAACKFKRNRYFSQYLSVEEQIGKQHGDKCMYYGGFYGFDKELCEKRWFGKGVKVPFENFMVTVPENSHAYLSQFYGDYMQLPPVEFRSSHHSRLFVDLNRRFTWEEIKNMNVKMSNKAIVRYES